jgi:hypothetical protein
MIKFKLALILIIGLFISTQSKAQGKFSDVVRVVYYASTASSGAACALTAWNGNPLAFVACPLTYKLFTSPDEFANYAEAGCNFIVTKFRLEDKVICEVKISSDNESNMKKIIEAIKSLEQ